ncbi:anticodon-binding aminoacyl-tRNA synthetase, class 1a, partial [Tanacetum coccineum]
HSLERGKADRIVHVADVGQRDKIEMCITASESVGWNVTNNCHDPLSHVGFVQVEGFEGFGLVQLLDEAKSRCKAILVGECGELEDTKHTEHTAEALGYGAVKYEVLKNNRLTGYTFSFDDMFKETGNTAVYLKKTHARICSRFGKSKNMLALADVVTLKDDRERQLGLHLLRFTEVLRPDKEDSKILLFEATRVVIGVGLLLLGIAPIYKI